MGTEDMLERDFFQPIGKKLLMDIENTGKEPLWVVSGKKENFVVSPVIKPGFTSTAKITIKQNSQGKFKFGLFSRTDLGQDNSNVQVNLFDARQAVNGKKIYIGRSEMGKFEASLLLTDEADLQPLRDAGTEQYRDAERICKKDWLGWIIPNAVTMFTSVLSALTGAPA